MVFVAISTGQGFAIGDELEKHRLTPVTSGA
jgi:hypothetical protein